MSDLFHRMTDAVLGSEFLPARVRIRLMRALGYDIGLSSNIWARGCLRSKKMRIGNNVFINVGFFFDGFEQLDIGDNVRVGQFVRVITATHKIGPAEQRCCVEVVGKPVTIGSGSWIGCSVTLLPGIRIAEGCVIGAGSVVTKSTLKNGLYVGAPARLIRFLDENDAEESRAELLQTSDTLISG